MDRLETVLMTFIQHTDQANAELHQFTVELSQELRQDAAEMKQWRLQAQKQWGEIANKLGTFVEDIVAPNIPRIGREILAANGDFEELLAAARLRVWHPQD